jgi:hypothetical protein
MTWGFIGLAALALRTGARRATPPPDGPAKGGVPRVRTPTRDGQVLVDE